MKYYLEEMINRQEEIDAYEAWEKYNIKDVMYHRVGSPLGEEIRFSSKVLNPHTLGPKVLGGYLVISNLSALANLRRDDSATVNNIWSWHEGSLEITVLGRYAEVKLRDLLEYSDVDLTEFFNNCLDVIEWPDSFIIRRINLSEATNLKLARELFNSENISRTHKIELLQKIL